MPAGLVLGSRMGWLTCWPSTTKSRKRMVTVDSLRPALRAARHCTWALAEADLADKQHVSGLLSNNGPLRAALHTPTHRIRNARHSQGFDQQDEPCVAHTGRGRAA